MGETDQRPSGQTRECDESEGNGEEEEDRETTGAESAKEPKTQRVKG